MKSFVETIFCVLVDRNVLSIVSESGNVSVTQLNPLHRPIEMIGFRMKGSRQEYLGREEYHYSEKVIGETSVAAKTIRSAQSVLLSQ